MASPLNITVNCHGSAVQLVVEGELDGDSAAELLDVVEAAISVDVDLIDVDLSQVWFLDSNGIHALVRAQRLAKAHESMLGYRCQLRVVRPSGIAGTVLHAAGVEGYLSVVDAPAFMLPA